jgi:hypothetical protein
MTTTEAEEDSEEEEDNNFFDDDDDDDDDDDTRYDLAYAQMLSGYDDGTDVTFAPTPANAAATGASSSRLCLPNTINPLSNARKVVLPIVLNCKIARQKICHFRCRLGCCRAGATSAEQWPTTRQRTRFSRRPSSLAAKYNSKINLKPTGRHH